MLNSNKSAITNKMVLSEIKRERDRAGKLIIVESLINNLSDKKISPKTTKEILNELKIKGKICEVKQGYIMLSKDMSNNPIRKNVTERRITELETEAKTLEIEIAGIKGNKPILTEREQSVVDKLKEIFAILGQPLQDTQTATLRYKERELENMKKVIEILKKEEKELTK